jgi:hypothetical protein
MKRVIFVHGTGVRKEGYDESYSQVCWHLSSEEMEVVRCLWGEACGVRLKGGVSIPDFDNTRSEDGISNDDSEASIWEALYEDPLFELRLLGMVPQPTGSARPDQRTAWQEIKPVLDRLQVDGELAEKLERCRLARFWSDARRSVTASAEFLRALQGRLGVTTQLRYIIARSLVAQALLLREISFEGEADWISGKERDELVETLVTELGDKDRTPGEWFLKNLLARPVTRYAQRRRRSISEQSFGVAGDILFYQARGQQIREYIRKKVEQYDKEVVLLAHSLGGIACVDLLIEHPLPQVEMLITFGSQAPFLYEINALVSLPSGEKLPGRLPDHFPKRWLNIYDPRDFLGYKAEGVFKGPAITDKRVNNRQPFPQAHTSYLDNDQIWPLISEALS